MGRPAPVCAACRWGGIGSSPYCQFPTCSADRARKRELTHTARGPLDRGECDNGGSRDGLGASTEPSTENPTGPSAITAGRGAVIRCLTAKHQPGRAMTRRGRNLWSRGVRSGQLGSVPAPAASRARGFNPGHAPHHRGIGVTPPGLDRENPWGIWGAGVRCRLGLLPTPSHKRRLRGSGGKCVWSLPAAVAYPLPGGWGVGFPRTRFASRPQPKPRASCQNSRTLLAVPGYRAPAGGA